MVKHYKIFKVYNKRADKQFVQKMSYYLDTYIDDLAIIKASWGPIGVYDTETKTITLEWYEPEENLSIMLDIAEDIKQSIYKNDPEITCQVINIDYAIEAEEFIERAIKTYIPDSNWR